MVFDIEVKVGVEAHSLPSVFTEDPSISFDGFGELEKYFARYSKQELLEYGLEDMVAAVPEYLRLETVKFHRNLDK